MTIATAVLAFVTFVLAIAAFTNIWLTRRIQAKVRRDKQLREVRDWAVDAIKAPHLVETPRWPPEVVAWEDDTKETYFRQTVHNSFDEENRHVALILAAGEYTRSLAGQLDGSLASAVENALHTLGKHHKLMRNNIAELYKALDVPRSEWEGLIARQKPSRQRVYDSAKAVICRATELLAT